jgi:hypothetical protein
VRSVARILTRGRDFLPVSMPIGYETRGYPCPRAELPSLVVGEVLEPCVRDNVAVGEVPEPCRSTAGSAAGILLTSPCFRRGLRTTVIMDARGEPSLPVTGTSQMGRRSCSLVA